MTSMSAFRSASFAASEGECKAALMELETCKNKEIPKVYEAMTLEVKMNEEVLKKAMEKCYDRYIPKLFAAMPDEVKMQEDFIKTAMEKCDDRHIPELFAAMPDEVKMREDVIKKALEKCNEFYIHELFKAMPAEVQKQEEVVKALLEKSYGSRIPRVFEVMPFDVQAKGDEVKEAIEGCNAYCIPALFEVMPTQWKMNEDFIEKAMEKCDDRHIPELFAAMLDEVKMQAVVAKKALQKCKDSCIHKLFKAMPTEVQMQEEVAKKALKKCSEYEIAVLFAAMPAEVQKQEDIVKMALEKCWSGAIPRLFAAMPAEVQKQEDVVKGAFENCSEFRIDELSAAMPAEVQKQEEVIKMALDKCTESHIHSLFKAMPDEVKVQADVVKRALRKCSDEKIPDLFKAIPAPAKPNATTAESQWQKECVLIAVDGMDALNNKALQDFQTSLPDNLQDDDEVESAFKRKKVSQLPLLQKYQKLLRAALEVSVMYLLILGPIEGALWFQRRAGGKIANLSNQHWKNKTDFAQVHFEIFDGCVLSAAPQPFDMTLPLTSLKLVLITAAFGFIKRDLMSVRDHREARWKVWICVVVMVYSVIMIPITFISLVVHYVQEVSPHIPGGFKKYECLYAIMNLAPFQTNYLMYFVQFKSVEFVSFSAGIDMFHVHQLMDCRFSRATDALVQPLLNDDTNIGKLQEFKIGGKFMLFFLTFAPYLCVEIPFIITHKIPAAGCFFPFVLLILAVTGCIFAIVNRDFLRNLKFDEWVKTVEEAGYMPVVPALWGLLVVNEFLTLAPIYWYGGAGWFDSGIMVLVERSLWIYVMVFWTKIMTKFWSAASFINEIS